LQEPFCMVWQVRAWQMRGICANRIDGCERGGHRAQRCFLPQRLFPVFKCEYLLWTNRAEVSDEHYDLQDTVTR
jgi:hypothetical protein